MSHAIARNLIARLGVLAVGMLLVVGCGSEKKPAPAAKSGGSAKASVKAKKPPPKTVPANEDKPFIPAPPAIVETPASPAPPGTAWDAFCQRKVRGLAVGQGTFRISREKQGNKLTDEQVELVDEMRTIGVQVTLLHAQGQIPQAIEALETTIAINRELWGDKPTSVGLLPTLGTYYEQAGRFAQAHALFAAIKLMSPESLGLRPWELDDCRRSEERLTKLLQMPAPQQERYQERQRLMQEVSSLHRKGAYHAALEPSQKVCDISKELFGDNSAEYALALNNLAALHLNLKDTRSLLPATQEAARHVEAALGERNPETLAALGNLAMALSNSGDANAELELRQRIVKLAGEMYGPDQIPADAAVNLARASWKAGKRSEARDLLSAQLIEIGDDLKIGVQNSAAESLVFQALAELSSDEGNFARAATAARSSALAAAKTYGESSVGFARSLTYVATLYYLMGDTQRAESLCEEALKMMKPLLGENHPEVASTSTILAKIEMDRKNYAESQKILEHALQVSKGAYGEENAVTAAYEAMLGLVRLLSGAPAESIPWFEQAAAKFAKEDSDGDSYASCLHQHALALLLLGQLKDAETKAQEALRRFVSANGIRHAGGAGYHKLLARIHAAQNNKPLALTELEQGLKLSEAFFLDTFAGQSERQRLETLVARRGMLDWRLSLAVDEADAGLTYEHVLRWKGAVASHARQLRGSDDQPELQRLISEVKELRARYATKAFATPPPQQRANWAQELERLRNEKEDREAELASHPQRVSSGRAGTDVGMEEILAALPSDVTFVDFLEYDRFDPAQSQKFDSAGVNCLAAFVLRKGSTVRRFDLGPVQPIEEQIKTWRSALQTGDDSALRQSNDNLWNAVLKPLAKELRGSGPLVVCPDGALNRLPLAALRPPGRDSYLIEFRAVAVVPSARQIVELLAPAEPGESPTLVTVGGVAYPDSQEKNAGANAPAAFLAEGLKNLKPLPGTTLEAEETASSYQHAFPQGTLVALTGTEANESRVAAELARRPRFVHLATHGFFASSATRSALRSSAPGEGLDSELRGISPWLLSGLVLAPATEPAGGESQGDGIMTAEEVNDLNLAGVELVVLSACETGLGDVAGGEGVLGLQRAFHIAGAKTVVTSLWKVDDAATSLLMQTFYDNLWNKKLSKLEALRQAQLSMLKSPASVAKRQKVFFQQLAQRGIALEDAPQGQPVVGESDTSVSPRYWAAFVLSGDPFGTVGPAPKVAR